MTLDMTDNEMVLLAIIKMLEEELGAMVQAKPLDPTMPEWALHQLQEAIEAHDLGDMLDSVDLELLKSQR